MMLSRKEDCEERWGTLISRPRLQLLCEDSIDMASGDRDCLPLPERVTECRRRCDMV